MEIIKKISGNEMIFALEGRLDTTTSPLLREQIAQIPPEVEKVEFDFRDLGYISSAGLREILVCRKKFSGDRMKVINVSQEVYEIFKTTGFDQIIPLETVTDDISTYMNLSFKAFLAKKAEKTPDAVALVDDRGAFTWKDVDIYSQIIAEGLSLKGIKKRNPCGFVRRKFSKLGSDLFCHSKAWSYGTAT